MLWYFQLLAFTSLDPELRPSYKFTFQGWHLCDHSLGNLTLAGTSMDILDHVMQAAPYSARIYTILRQSGVQLNCFSGDVGEGYIKFVETVSSEVLTG